MEIEVERPQSETAQELSSGHLEAKSATLATYHVNEPDEEAGDGSMIETTGKILLTAQEEDNTKEELLVNPSSETEETKQGKSRSKKSSK